MITRFCNTATRESLWRIWMTRSFAESGLSKNVIYYADFGVAKTLAECQNPWFLEDLLSKWIEIAEKGGEKGRFLDRHDVLGGTDWNFHTSYYGCQLPNKEMHCVYDIVIVRTNLSQASAALFPCPDTVRWWARWRAKSMSWTKRFWRLSPPANGLHGVESGTRIGIWFSDSTYNFTLTPPTSFTSRAQSADTTELEQTRDEMENLRGKWQDFSAQGVTDNRRRVSSKTIW